MENNLNRRQEFEHFMIGHTDLETKKYVKRMYFEKPKGCVPTEYLGDDLLYDIRTKFYFPLAYLRWLFANKKPEFKNSELLITIDPSYEGATNYNVILNEQKIVLLQGSFNAWNFWFKDEKEFDCWVENCLEEMAEELKNNSKR